MEISMGDFILSTCQATMFTPDEEVSAARLLRGSLLATWGELFDGEPTVLPPIDGMPAELPRITLQSKSLVWKCEIGPGRINFYWQRVDKDQPQIDVNEFQQIATDRLEEFLRWASPRVGRLALVINRFARAESPARLLAEHFCKPEWLVAPFNRPENFELHSHKRFSLGDEFQVNSWVRCKTASERDGGHPVVVCEQDLNTLQEDTNEASFSAEQMHAFFRHAASEMNAILALYFPE